MLLGGGVADYADGFGGFHDHQRNQNQTEPDQVQLGGEVDQSESGGDGREQHQRDQQRGGESGEVQRLVGERADLEQGVVGAHVERLHNLAHGQHHERQRLTAGYP